MLKEYNKIFKLIKKHKKIYIARHIGPDPDAIASQTALKNVILETFPEKEVYAIGASVAKFKYFGKLDKVVEFDYKNGLAIMLDVPDIKRVDGLSVERFNNTIKIDHHPEVDKYATIELVNVKASSTCEIILDLINNTKFKCNKKAAENIFMGIVSDSNRFLFDTTTSKTFHMVANLINEYNLNITDLYSTLYKKPLSEVRLMGYIANNLKVLEGGFAYIILEEKKIKEMGADSSSASNMINDFNNINEVLAWAFITISEDETLYKANIRSRGPVINEIAARYNGGGHKFASGAKISNKRDVDAMLKDLEQACIDYKID